MARTCQIVSLLALALLISIRSSYGQGPTPPKKVPPVWKGDLKFIRCEACELLVKELTRQVKSKQDELGPKKRVEEFAIIEMVENACNPETDEGEWITRFDMKESGRQIKLVDQGQQGECRSECRTIARACQEAIGDFDTDIAEALFKGAARAALTNRVCHKYSKACASKPPPVPKDRKPGEAFKVKDAKDAEIEKLMRTMQNVPGMGSMNMFKRDDYLNQMGMGGGDDEDDEDDEEKDELDGAAHSGPDALFGKKAKEGGQGKQPETVKEKIVAAVDVAKAKVEDVAHNLRAVAEDVAGNVVLQAQGLVSKVKGWIGASDSQGTAHVGEL